MEPFDVIYKEADAQMYITKQNYYRRNGIKKLNDGYGREGQYRRAILYDAVAFFEVNLSRDTFITAAVHVEDGLPRDLFEAMGMNPITHYSGYVDFFSATISDDMKEQYFSFFDCHRLIDCFHNGALEQTFNCWVTDPIGRRRLSKYILLIGQNENTRDIIALCISKDITDTAEKDA